MYEEPSESAKLPVLSKWSISKFVLDAKTGDVHFYLLGTVYGHKFLRDGTGLLLKRLERVVGYNSGPGVATTLRAYAGSNWYELDMPSEEYATKFPNWKELKKEQGMVFSMALTYVSDESLL